MAEENVLELETIRKRRWITIDGKRVEMYDQNEIAMAPSVRLKLLINSGSGAHEMDEAAAGLFSKRLEAAMNDVLVDAPSEVLAKLSDDQRLTILVAFFKATEKLAPTPAANPQPSAT